MFLALLRLIECSGQIEIDGVNITRLPRSVVRERGFIAVPQDGFMLPKESMRFNLDPNQVVSDEIIRQVLQKTGLWQVFSGDSPVDETIFDKPLGSLPTLSVGQSQLLALARGIVQKHAYSLARYSDDVPQEAVKPIILLDEAISSLDSETESQIYDLVEEEFVEQGHTVIIVSHRLDGLVRRLRPGKDAVAVLSDGQLTVKVNLDEIKALAAEEDAN